MFFLPKKAPASRAALADFRDEWKAGNPGIDINKCTAYGGTLNVNHTFNSIHSFTKQIPNLIGKLGFLGLCESARQMEDCGGKANVRVAGKWAAILLNIAFVLLVIY